jgi:uncharacterized protein (TIGR00369 family)
MGTQDTNLYGSVHGGVVMRLIDDAAAAAAGRHAGMPALTRAVESMEFRSPARAGDLLTARAQLISAGRTSMRVRVVVGAERWNEVGPWLLIATAQLIFVAVDASGSAATVPAVLEADEDLDWLTEGITDTPAEVFVPSEQGQRSRRASG